MAHSLSHFHSIQLILVFAVRLSVFSLPHLLLYYVLSQVVHPHLYYTVYVCILYHYMRQCGIVMWIWVCIICYLFFSLHVFVDIRPEINFSQWKLDIKRKYLFKISRALFFSFTLSTTWLECHNAKSIYARARITNLNVRHVCVCVYV